MTRGARQLAKYDANKSRVARLKRFGLTIPQYDEMVRRQGGVCPICGTEPKNRRFPVDHDHTSRKKPSRLYGRIRGAPCHACNRYRIGLNDVETAYRVWRYLESDFNGRDL